MKVRPENMEKQAPKKNWARHLLRGGGLALGIFLIYWFASKSNLSGIADELRLINVRFVFLIAVTFIAYLMVTLAWKLSFYNYPGHISTSLLFVIRQIGESLAQINPTNVIAGEALKALLLKRKNIPYKDSIVSLTISRFLVLFSALTLIMIGVYLFFDQLRFRAGAVSMVITIGILFALLVFFIYRLGSGGGILFLPVRTMRLLRKKFPESERLERAIAKLKEVDGELIDFYKTKKANFITAFLLSLGSWFMGAMEFWVILYLLGLKASFLSCVAVEVGVMVFKGLGAFVPGQIGIEEYANKVMLEFINVPGSGVWITVSILRRARQLFWIGFGFIALIYIIRKTGSLEDGNTVYNS
ncbi:MAG: flippase-like domain-containing protein [Spirochaetes bacterium]|nr:flippase-like domain-containing protein [Spirochaetota bacterium]